MTDTRELAGELRVVLGRLVRRMRAERDEEALSLRKVTVLGRLDRAGPAGVSDLAADERVRPQSMAATVASLVDAGLVDRRPDPADGRRVLIDLLPAGRAALEADRRRRIDWLANTIERDLTVREQRVLAEAAELLARLTEGDAGRRRGRDRFGIGGPAGFVPVDTAGTLWRVARMTSRLRAPAAAVVMAGMVAVTGACSSSMSAGAPSQAGGVSAPPATPAVHFSIKPSNGHRRVPPGKTVMVSVTNGKLTGVTAGAPGDPLTGKLKQGHTVWISRTTLHTATRYTVHATAVDAAGHTVTATSRFRTLAPSQVENTTIFEAAHGTYGVGMPIMLTFDHPVTNRRAVERALHVAPSKPVTGAWYWDGNSTVYFRPGTTGRSTRPCTSRATWTASRRHPAFTGRTR